MRRVRCALAALRAVRSHAGAAGCDAAQRATCTAAPPCLHVSAARAARDADSRARNQLRRWSSTLRAPAESGALSAALRTRLEELRLRYDELSEALSADPPLPLDRIVAINKELGQLSPIMDAFVAVSKLEDEMATLAEVASSAGDDAEMRALADEERAALAARLPPAAEELALMLVPTDEADSRDAVLEVRAGAGGDEASLFAMDLLRMYERYAARQPGWRFEILSIAAGPAGEGAKEASASVTGPGAFGRLRHEIGVHRVQRVPATETQGRVHTSTASVAVLAAADAVDCQVRDEDIRIDTYRSGGAGGQHVNTTDSAVRVTHLPTGTVVAIQDERSQHKNKAKALKVLHARIFDAARERAAREHNAQRRDQIGTADRSERVRTYNFGQSRVKDHRCGVTVNDAEAMMRGERLDDFIDALAAAERAAKLAAMEGKTVTMRGARPHADDD